jgi:hypothetical protein
VIIKGIIPVAMAGVRGIYGLVLSIIIMSGIHPEKAGPPTASIPHSCGCSFPHSETASVIPPHSSTVCSLR